MPRAERVFHAKSGRGPPDGNLSEIKAIHQAPSGETRGDGRLIVHSALGEVIFMRISALKGRGRSEENGKVSE